MKVKVVLRRKKISKGRMSLYLDFYPPIPHSVTGKDTRREFLKKYILENPKTIFEKKNNTEILLISEQIRAKRENELFKAEIYSIDEKEKLRLNELGESDFVEYFENQMNERNGSTYDNWNSALNYLKDFTNGSLKFNEINVKVLENFKIFLLTTNSKRSNKAKLSKNSAVSYFNKVRATLKKAYIEDYIKIDFNAKVKPIEVEETVRNFLTEEELNLLFHTPCDNDFIKRIALFSSLTSMAFKEIQNLLWKDITYEEGNGYTILTKRQKTQKFNYLPVPEQAIEFLGERKNDDEKVFPKLKYSAYLNKLLREWVQSSGIAKKITFHCFRHTYAIIQIKNGTDIFVLSKMLGHKNIQTTLIYAKVVDELKRETTNKIQLT